MRPQVLSKLLPINPKQLLNNWSALLTNFAIKYFLFTKYICSPLFKQIQMSDSATRSVDMQRNLQKCNRVNNRSLHKFQPLAQQNTKQNKGLQAKPSVREQDWLMNNRNKRCPKLLSLFQTTGIGFYCKHKDAIFSKPPLKADPPFAPGEHPPLKEKRQNQNKPRASTLWVIK